MSKWSDRNLVSPAYEETFFSGTFEKSLFTVANSMDMCTACAWGFPVHTFYNFSKSSLRFLLPKLEGFIPSIQILVLYLTEFKLIVSLYHFYSSLYSFSRMCECQLSSRWIWHQIHIWHWWTCHHKWDIIRFDLSVYALDSKSNCRSCRL